MKITVYCASSSVVDEIYREATRDLGRLIGERGHTLVFGGTDIGLMGVLAKAVRGAGGHVTGIIPERLVAYGRHTFDAGEAAMAEIIRTGAAFTAVLASNDESAFGAYRALGNAGMKVPQDVAVIGFDDRPECAVQEPALTSVHSPLVKMGYRAVELLVQQIRGHAAPVDPEMIATRLVLRESCGCGWTTFRSQLTPASSEPAVEPGQFDDRRAQLAQVMAETILAETGSDIRHLAKASYFVCDADASRGFDVVRPIAFDPLRPPAASLVMVHGVGRAGRTLTMDVIAVGK